MEKLIKNLRCKAMMISLCEHIAWGSDTDLMLEAADELEKLSARISKLESEAVAYQITVENLQTAKGFKYTNQFVG
jgi:hypothetical protein